MTTPVCTLVDMAAEVGWRTIERAVNDADKRDLVDPDVLRAALDDYRGVPGVRLLRAVLDKHTFRLFRHEPGSPLPPDRSRGRPATASGLTTLRFSHYQVEHEPGHVRSVLAKTARHLAPE